MMLMLMVLVAMMPNLDIRELQLGILSRFHCSRSSKLRVLELRQDSVDVKISFGKDFMKSFVSSN